MFGIFEDFVGSFYIFKLCVQFLEGKPDDGIQHGSGVYSMFFKAYGNRRWIPEERECCSEGVSIDFGAK